jgi:hypothetical protein
VSDAQQTKQTLVRFELPKKSKDSDNLRETTTLLGFTVPLLEPLSPAGKRWSHIMVVPLSYEAWAIPFRLALSSPGMPGAV